MAVSDAIAGVVNHLGWAVAVTVVRRAGGIEVIDRRRLELLDADLPNCPHEHHADRLSVEDAEALVARVRASAASHAHAALAALRAELGPKAVLRAIAIREGPVTAIPATVPEVLESLAAKYAADGEIFRRALCGAAEALDVQVAVQPRKPDTSGASAVLGTDAEEFLRAMRKTLGPPWAKDQRDATTNAICALR